MAAGLVGVLGEKGGDCRCVRGFFLGCLENVVKSIVVIVELYSVSE